MKLISDALELLTAQHDEIASLLTALPTMTGERRALGLGELADKLMTHLAAEEELFYPALGGEVSTRPAAEWSAEHEAIAVTVSALLGLDASSSDTGVLLDTLGSLFEGHVRAQEDALFVTVAEAISAAELTALGSELGAWSESSRCIAA